MERYIPVAQTRRLVIVFFLEAEYKRAVLGSGGWIQTFRQGGTGWGVHADPDIRGKGGLVSKKIFLALRASVWSKNQGGGPPLDPPLLGTTKGAFRPDLPK